MEPPPPPTFSTTTLCPNVSPRRWAKSRASMSVVAPAGNGTITRMVRLGKRSWARRGVAATSVAATAVAAAPTTAWRRVMVVLDRSSRGIRLLMSHHHQYRVLDQALERADELGAKRTINGPVIGGQRHGHQHRGFDPAAAHHRPLLAGADRQDGRVRRVDDGGEILDAVHAEVRHGGGAALILLGLELARPRPRREILHLVGDGGERFRLGATDHRRNQAARNGY